MDLPPSAQRVAAAARELGLELAVTRFPEGTRTAADAARAIGCDVGAIVKSIVLMTDSGPVLVLTSGRNTVDYDLVAAALDRTGVRKASADEAREATGYAIGGTPPFGHPTRLPTLIDPDLLHHDRVWAAAGTPDTVFPLTPVQLMEAADAAVAEVAA